MYLHLSVTWFLGASSLQVLKHQHTSGRWLQGNPLFKISFQLKEVTSPSIWLFYFNSPDNFHTSLALIFYQKQYAQHIGLLNRNKCLNYDFYTSSVDLPSGNFLLKITNATHTIACCAYLPWTFGGTLPSITMKQNFIYTLTC